MYTHYERIDINVQKLAGKGMRYLEFSLAEKTSKRNLCKILWSVLLYTVSLSHGPWNESFFTIRD